MLRDIQTVCWKEWREYLARGGTRSSGLLTLALMLVFSAFIPYTSGSGWATSPLAPFLSGVFFPLTVTMTVVADSFAGERERHTLETLLASRLSDRAILLGKWAALTSYGWLFGLVTALVSIVVANIGALRAAPFFYTPAIAGAIVVLGLLSAGLVASVGCLVSLRASTVRQAQQTLSLALMIPLIVSVVGAQFVPADAQARLLRPLEGMSALTIMLGGVLVLVGLNGVLLALALARFRRDRLLLD